MPSLSVCSRHSWPSTILLATATAFFLVLPHCTSSSLIEPCLLVKECLCCHVCSHHHTINLYSRYGFPAVVVGLRPIVLQQSSEVYGGRGSFSLIPSSFRYSLTSAIRCLLNTGLPLVKATATPYIRSRSEIQTTFFAPDTNPMKRSRFGSTATIFPFHLKAE